MVDEGVSCFVPGCQEPVAGRCNCGNHYCARHASTGECLRCLERQVLRETAERACDVYVGLAKAVAPRSPVWSVVVAVVVASVPTLLCLIVQHTAGLLISILSPLVLAPLIALADLARSRRQVQQVAAEKQGFAEFYRAWQAHSDREHLLATLQEAGTSPAGDLPSK